MPSPEPTAASLSAVVLAAGQGTRMKSGTHKVLHEVAGRAMIDHALDAIGALGATRPVVVLGHLVEQVRTALPATARSVLQEPQLGTGHAVQVAAELLRADGLERLLVTVADVPLVRTETLRGLTELAVGPGAPIALLTARVPDPTGYGRVLRTAAGTVDGMVEHAEATAEQRLIDEMWSGVMLLYTPWLWENLFKLEKHEKGEYFLPDLVNLARAEGLDVLAFQAPNHEEVHGVNDRAQLAEANRILYRRKLEELMASGVTVVDPANTYIDARVQIAPDATVRPGCHLRGETSIAAGCDIGPDTEIVDSAIGANTRVWRSVIEGSTIGSGVSVGPFSHVRPGSTISDGVELGNYAEVKGSVIGADSKMHHFGYIGDAVVGERVNYGAGAITMNYDGTNKHRTTIGDDAFIGSDTMLRAPVNIGDGAATGGGSVVTHDVPAGEQWAGVPARPLKRKDTQQEPDGPK